jgi:hypothetical protein
MITFYFDSNIRTLIQTPGNQSPALAQTWVYGDNYNLGVYIVAGGQAQPISASDTLTAILYQPQPGLPEQQLAIIGTPTHLTDANGNQYFSLNINLATTQLAALVQTPNKPAICQFHFVFNPADLERFSESQDLQITVNPDPLQGATGGTPVPPGGYPANPNVFELIANKGAAGGYAPLVGGMVPAANLPAAIPPDTVTIQNISGKLTAVTATATVLGIIKPDGTTTTIAAGVLSGLAPDGTTIQLTSGKLAAMLATATAPGIVKPDGTTITIAGGVISVPATGGLPNISARAQSSVNQSIPGLGANTALTLASFNFNNGSWTLTGSPTTRLTIPVGQAGVYSVGGTVFWQATLQQTYIFFLRVNGVTQIAYDQRLVPVFSSGSSGATQSCGTLWTFAAGDYIEMMVQFPGSAAQPAAAGSSTWAYLT